ncbi:hypothetical protein [Burkholderia sp. F1]|uniref:hypothetical protein n=1 Tax=Burkholderia sp. F1 TaxID=3366817 RepID=UPI003D704F63
MPAIESPFSLNTAGGFDAKICGNANVSIECSQWLHDRYTAAGDDRRRPARQRGAMGRWCRNGGGDKGYWFAIRIDDAARIVPVRIEP